MKTNEIITNRIAKIANANVNVESLGTGVLRVTILDSKASAMEALNRRFNVTSSFEYEGNTIAIVFLF